MLSVTISDLIVGMLLMYFIEYRNTVFTKNYIIPSKK